MFLPAAGQTDQPEKCVVAYILLFKQTVEGKSFSSLPDEQSICSVQGTLQHNSSQASDLSLRGKNHSLERPFH
jgi:hypothetical protein